MINYLDPLWSPNRNQGGNGKAGICIHHGATTNFYNIGATFQNTALQTSAHYGVGEGIAQQYVPENDIAWAAGNSWANGNLIHIEAVNSSGAPEWAVSDETFETLAELMADIARRNNMYPLVVGKNLFGHKDFYNTFCPGVLYNRLGTLAQMANEIVENGGVFYMNWSDNLARPGGGSIPASQAIAWGWHWASKAFDKIVDEVLPMLKSINVKLDKVSSPVVKVDNLDIDYDKIINGVADELANRMKD